MDKKIKDKTAAAVDGLIIFIFMLVVFLFIYQTVDVLNTAASVRQRSTHSLSLLEASITEDIYESLTEKQFDHYQEVILDKNNNLKPKYEKQFFDILKENLNFNTETNTYKGRIFEIEESSVKLNTAMTDNNSVKITLTMTVHYKTSFFMLKDNVDFIVKDMVVASDYNFFDIQNSDENFDKVSGDGNGYKDKGAGLVEYTVNGTVSVAQSPSFNVNGPGIGGITVSVDGENVYAVTKKDGSYSVPGLEAGEYTLTISGPTTIDRKAKLVVSESNAIDKTITVDDVQIVICDYNKDGFINAIDLGEYGGYMNNYYIYADFNQDGFVNAIDTGTFSAFYGTTIKYPDITLQ